MTTNLEWIALAARSRRRREVRRRLAAIAVVTLSIVLPASLEADAVVPMIDGTVLVPQSPPQTYEVPQEAQPSASASAPAEVAVVVTTTIIQEDDPEFDCQTMGNKVCGPGAPGGPSVAGWPAEPTVAWVVACAEALGGSTDGNLAKCADWAGLPCGNLYVDPHREDC